MRVLFAHLSENSRTEYDVHRILAENVDPEKVECFFIWQSNPGNPATNQVANLGQADRNFYYDFGRNFSLVPKPSRLHRAFLMARQLPGSLLFLRKKIKEIKPDVVYTSQQKWELQLVNLVCSFMRVPHLIHLHYIVGPWLGNTALQVILNSRHLFAVSDFTREGAIKAGVKPKFIDTIHNPVDLVRFNVPRDSEWLRLEFGWPPETQVVVAAGKLNPSKGFMNLLEAFAQVHLELPFVKLLICGETTIRDAYDEVLKAKAVALGLQGSVVFAGNRKDLPYIFAGADLFCLPTENESLGLVFLEAMLTELPVVAVRSGGVPEVVVEGETGLLSEPGDINSLSTNLLKLLCEPQLAKKMGSAGKSHVLANFSPTTLSAKWAELLCSHFENRMGKNVSVEQQILELEDEFNGISGYAV